MTSFAGFSPAAIEFYRELEDHNDRDWWQAHKDVYDREVRDPMGALLEELAPEFEARATIFRPHRDVRFSADKSPYKTHQGGYLGTPGGSAYYVHLDGDGLFAGAGIWHMQSDQIARYRASVDEQTSGDRLAGIVSAAQRQGYQLGGDIMKTRPRGVPADHPRVELLRLRSIHLRKEYDTPAWLATPATLDEVRANWTALRPFVAWLDDCVGRSELPDR